jgi:hypothetical protein
VIIRLKVLDKKDKSINISDILLKLYYQMITIAIKCGKPFQRWTERTPCMIEKKAGIARINKLRVIHLFETDYSLILKVMWARKVVWTANNKNILNKSQAGSRPGCRATDAALHKEMKYNYATLTRTPIATIDNDAKSCDDRILCNVAMMISKYFGVSHVSRKLNLGSELQ